MIGSGSGLPNSYLAEQLLNDPQAAPRVRRSFEHLLARSRAAEAAT